jgi:hypothetical protein
MNDMTPAPTPRRSPLRRQTTNRYPLSAIDQGERVLLTLGSLRFATITQLRRAIFDRLTETPSQARHRATNAARRLFDAGFINRTPVFCPAAASDQLSLQVVQTLSAAGARAIGMDPTLARSRAPKARSVLAHDFWLTELGVLAMEGIPESLAVTRWWNDRVLAARKRKGQLSLPTIPDALLTIRHQATGRDYACLIELDLGTESVASRGRVRPDFSRKIEGYLDYLGAGFRADFGLDTPPIVLIVADSDRRLESLKAAAARLGGGGRFWFATLPRLRGIDDSRPATHDSPAARKGAFWGLHWSVPNQDGLRSLARRCGV